MPAVTTCRSLPYPLDTDPIDVAGDIHRLATKVDTDLCDLYARVRGSGVGLVTPSTQVQPDTNPLIVWSQEAYDTDGFHAANSTDVIIPTGRTAVYACSLLMT